DLLRLYNVDVDDKEKYEPVADPYLTQLVSDNNNGHGGSLPGILNQCPPLATTLKPELKDRTLGIVCARLGLAEFTMYPMIRPAALLQIDTNQTKLTPVAWRNEYERPIFFIEL